MCVMREICLSGRLLVGDMYEGHSIMIPVCYINVSLCVPAVLQDVTTEAGEVGT